MWLIQTFLLYPGSSPVEVIFSNPDLLWANEHPVSRFGQVGAAGAAQPHLLDLRQTLNP